ncbi:MAG: membrane protein insertase YidC, partial [Robiginitalea sp.]
MEEKKLDPNSIIGFLLIFGILLFWFYTNQPTPEELEAQQQATEQVEPDEVVAETPQPITPIQQPVTYPNDSLAQQAYASQVGA